MSEHREFEELVALDALDALDAPDRARLEAHLASGCDQCLSEGHDAKRIADELLAATTPSMPNESIRVALVARVRDDAAGQKGSSVGNSAVNSTGRASLWPVLAAAAGLVVALAAGFYARSLQNSLAEETARRQTAEVEAERLRSSLASVTSPRNRAVSLDGLEAAASARATAFLDRENRRLFLYVENLPALPPDRTYQIWLLVDGTPVSVGTFDVDSDGGARLDGEPLPRFRRQRERRRDRRAGGRRSPTDRTDGSSRLLKKIRLPGLFARLRNA